MRKLRPGSRGPAVRLRDDANSTGGAACVRWGRSGQILYPSKKGLAVTDEAGTSARVVGGEELLVWDWSPDGALIYAIREGSGRRMDLIAIDAKSGAVRVVADLGRKPVTPEPIGYRDPIRSLAVSPDGKRAVYAYLQPDSQIWMMDPEKR